MSPRGHLTMFAGISRKRGAAGPWWIEARDTNKHSTVCGTEPHSQELPGTDCLTQTIIPRSRIPGLGPAQKHRLHHCPQKLKNMSPSSSSDSPVLKVVLTWAPQQDPLRPSLCLSATDLRTRWTHVLFHHARFPSRRWRSSFTLLG